MFRSIVLSAFGAGLVACVAVTALQRATTEPLILHAETFEGAAEAAPAADSAPAPLAAAPAEAPSAGGHDHDAHDHAVAAHDHAASGHVHDADAWQPADGFERTAYTALANLLIGVAVSLVLLGLMVLKGGRIDARSGLLWGAAGFVAVSLLPALGLPPELPGTATAEITARQAWWLGTAAASAAGLAALAFGRAWPWRVAGLVLLVAPHAIGAPQPPTHGVPYPGALAGEFVIASIVVSAVLWSLSGLVAGWLHRRLAAAA